MTPPQQHILVTAHSHGDMDYFPRLHTALRAYKSQLEGKVWLVDTGAAWSSESWICQATENRAPYLVMDAMGYDVIFADGLTSENRQRLVDQMITKLLMPATSYVLPESELALLPSQDADQAYIDEHILYLPLPLTKNIYHIQLNQMTIAETSVNIVGDSGVLPDATIAAAIEFVISEAQYYQKKQDRG